MQVQYSAYGILVRLKLRFSVCDSEWREVRNLQSRNSSQNSTEIVYRAVASREVYVWRPVSTTRDVCRVSEVPFNKSRLGCVSECVRCGVDVQYHHGRVWMLLSRFHVKM